MAGNCCRASSAPLETDRVLLFMPKLYGLYGSMSSVHAHFYVFLVGAHPVRDAFGNVTKSIAHRVGSYNFIGTASVVVVGRPTFLANAAKRGSSR
jgi:hypothetical protein